DAGPRPRRHPDGRHESRTGGLRRTYTGREPAGLDGWGARRAGCTRRSSRAPARRARPRRWPLMTAPRESAPRPLARITDAAIDPIEVEKAVWTTADGAMVTFSGIVR